MNPDQILDTTIAYLNDLFRRDPAAIKSLLVNTVPAGEALADDSCPVPLTRDPTIQHSLLTVLGLINGLMSVLLPGDGRLLHILPDWEGDGPGPLTLKGFTRGPRVQDHQSDPV